MPTQGSRLYSKFKILLQNLNADGAVCRTTVNLNQGSCTALQYLEWKSLLIQFKYFHASSLLFADVIAIAAAALQTPALRKPSERKRLNFSINQGRDVVCI